MQPLAYAIVILAALTVPLLGPSGVQPVSAAAETGQTCYTIDYSTNPPQARPNPDCIGTFEP